MPFTTSSSCRRTQSTSPCFVSPLVRFCAESPQISPRAPSLITSSPAARPTSALKQTPSPHRACRLDLTRCRWTKWLASCHHAVRETRQPPCVAFSRVCPDPEARLAVEAIVTPRSRGTCALTAPVLGRTYVRVVGVGADAAQTRVLVRGPAELRRQRRMPGAALGARIALTAAARSQR